MPSTAELVDRLSRFDGPPEHFLLNLLAVQCHIASASGGAILRSRQRGHRGSAGGRIRRWPQGATAPVWLAQAVESAAAVQSDGATAVKPLQAADDLYGSPARQLAGDGSACGGGQGVRGLAAFVVDTGDPSALEVSRERLELTVSLLSLYEMRLTLQRRQPGPPAAAHGDGDARRRQRAGRFAGAAMALCNELASRWYCQRVGLGFLKGRYVHLKALSHTEKFSRKMKLVQDIEAAMEECLDQDVEVAAPCRARRRPTSAGRPASCPAGTARRRSCSLPLRRAGEPVGVVTLERAARPAVHAWRRSRPCA